MNATYRILPVPQHSRETYSREYASYYDKLTAHKDYKSEADALIDLLDKRNVRQPSKILDIGCGTGTHAALLAERGYEVVAIDTSPDMINVGRSKHSTVHLKRCDISELPDGTFHFAYSLYNVINYLTSIEELIAFFQSISDHLVPGGSLFVESWNPFALIANRPMVVERVYESDTERLVRNVVPVLDLLRQRLDLYYNIDVHGPGPDGVLRKQFSAIHSLVLFTPQEIEYCLRLANFQRITLRTALPRLDSATENDRMLAFMCDKAG